MKDGIVVKVKMIPAATLHGELGSLDAQGRVRRVRAILVGPTHPTEANDAIDEEDGVIVRSGSASADSSARKAAL